MTYIATSPNGRFANIAILCYICKDNCDKCDVVLEKVKWLFLFDWLRTMQDGYGVWCSFANQTQWFNTVKWAKKGMWKCFPFDYGRYVGAAFCKTHRFALQNKPFWDAKQAVLRRETGLLGMCNRFFLNKNLSKQYGFADRIWQKNEGIGCTFGRKLFLSPASPAYYDCTSIFLLFRCIDCFSRIWWFCSVFA